MVYKKYLTQLWQKVKRLHFVGPPFSLFSFDQNPSWMTSILKFGSELFFFRPPFLSLLLFSVFIVLSYLTRLLPHEAETNLQMQRNMATKASKLNRRTTKIKHLTWSHVSRKTTQTVIRKTRQRICGFKCLLYFSTSVSYKFAIGGPTCVQDPTTL